MNEQAAFLTETINAIIAGADALLLEFLLVLFFLLLVTLDLFKSPALKKQLPWLALTGFFATLVLQLLEGRFAGNPQFLNLLLSDGVAQYAGILFSLAGIFTVLLSVLNKRLDGLAEGRGEYYAFLLLLILGLNLMAKSVNLLMLFLAIEVVSIASYLLTLTLKENKRAIDAAIKYILYGSLSAGVMLYGMSFFYGLTGSLGFTGEAFGLALLQASPLMVTVAAVLVFAGFLFKISAAPFHFWAPDVYQGAPMPVVALFSTGPKMAGIIVIMRFVTPFAADASAYADVWLLLGILALVTLVLGNFTALWQQTPRRLLAYSSVSHAGFLLLALMAVGTNYTSGLLFYLTVLLFMNFGIFLVLQLAEDTFRVERLSDFTGIGRAYPFLGTMAVIYLLSLTGLPPFAGFMGKLFIFTNLWEAYSLTSDKLVLTLLVGGVLLTGVALFYYIKIPYYLFIKGNLRTDNLVIALSDKLLLALFALPLLVFFFKPDLLLHWIEKMLTATF